MIVNTLNIIRLIISISPQDIKWFTFVRIAANDLKSYQVNQNSIIQWDKAFHRTKMNTEQKFKALNRDARTDLITQFLIKSPDFLQFLQTKLSPQFNEGDIAIIKGQDRIVKIHKMNVDKPWEVVHALGSTINSTVLQFATEEYYRDWEDNLDYIQPDQLEPMPTHIFLHFYHEMFRNGKPKKTLSMLASFNPNVDETIVKTIKVPVKFTETTTQETINFYDIDPDKNPYEIVFIK